MHKLSDYAGKKVILYFYPKDNTAGCTKQACGFSERYPQFMEKGVVILGVSKDSVASHKRFEEKYGLVFTLLADTERKVIEAPAVLSYEGITFQYMAQSVFEDRQFEYIQFEYIQFEYIQDRLRILSAFYGVLKPMDGVTPYRLELIYHQIMNMFLNEIWQNYLDKRCSMWASFI